MIDHFHNPLITISLADLRARAVGRPRGYFERVLSLAERVDAAHYHIRYDRFAVLWREFRTEPPPQPPAEPMGTLGPKLWREMEHKADRHDLNDAVLNEIGRWLPCGQCVRHFAAYRSANPLPNDKRFQPQWVRRLHNTVNVLRGLDPWPDL